MAAMASRPVCAAGLPPGVAKARAQAFLEDDEEGLHCRYEPLGELVVPPFLQGYGYKPADCKSWTQVPGAVQPSPVLEMRVSGHAEVDGHTLYTVDCALSPSASSSARATWSVQRRLHHLREDIHDTIKRSLAEKYSVAFQSTPFAAFGGLPGTTSRLDAWMRKLAECVNKGVLDPTRTALVLHWFEAPDALECCEPELDEEDVGLTLDPGALDMSTVFNSGQAAPAPRVVARPDV